MRVLISGADRATYSVLRSIAKRAPIICESRTRRQELIRMGKSLCEKMYPGNKVFMPEPIIYSELTEIMNPSHQYIIEDLDSYLRYNGLASVDTVCIKGDD